jgi:hypothetical protein
VKVDGEEVVLQRLVSSSDELRKILVELWHRARVAACSSSDGWRGRDTVDYAATMHLVPGSAVPQGVRPVTRSEPSGELPANESTPRCERITSLMDTPFSSSCARAASAIPVRSVAINGCVHLSDQHRLANAEGILAATLHILVSATPLEGFEERVHVRNTGEPGRLGRAFDPEDNVRDRFEQIQQHA